MQHQPNGHGHRSGSHREERCHH
ncbi:MAG: hypothetical protein FD153_1280, partial [Rhodospirillaceae bacterium]